MSQVYDHFFDVIEELGYFDHIYERLPQDFTAVFEIARVLEDDTHPLTRLLAPALALNAPDAPRRKDPDRPEPQVILEEAEEYEAQLLRHPRHLPRIYTSQWLLPEEVFYQRLAKKELWVPYPKEPTYFPVEPDTGDYAPDSRKQKLYILLDTSSSMAVRRRIHLAKAVVYHVLKTNMKELGYINLRTFDTTVGELHVANDRQSFHALISYIMRLGAPGNGTAMARAIAQAVADINAMPHLSGAEILIVTDGACALNEADMRRLLGDSTSINTIKIGKTQMHASDAYILDKLSAENDTRYQPLITLQRKRKELERLRDRAQNPALRHRYEESLRFSDREIREQLRQLEAEVVGHELERLSQVYVTVDDVNLENLVTVNRERCLELSAHCDAIAAEMDEHPTLEHLRRIAIMAEHVRFLAKYTGDQACRTFLEHLLRRIETRLQSNITGERAPETSSFWEHLPAEDRHDVEFLSGLRSAPFFPNWKLFLHILLSRFRSFIRR